MRRGRGRRARRRIVELRGRPAALRRQHRRAERPGMTEHATRNRFVTGALEVTEGADAMAIPLEGGSDEALVERTELIEPGRALALADFDAPAISAGERLIRLAYRLGVSGHTLSSPFRRPVRPRMLATVASPLHGDPVAGTALRAGHFLVHGVKIPIAQVDFSPAAKLAPPFERTLHGFTWMRDLEACAPRAQCMQTAERVLALWLEANGKPGKGAAWKVGHAGHRLLGWLVRAPLILSGSDKALRT